MSLLSDFFIASESEAADYDGGQGFAESERRQFSDLTIFEAASLLGVLRGSDQQDAPIDEFEPLVPDDVEELTMSVPRDMVERLSKLSPGEIPEIASQWSDATGEELPWPAEALEPILIDLVELAARAQDGGKKLYFWSSL